MKALQKNWRLALVLVGIYIVYVLTAYPTISWVDSGGIAAAACTLGIANPPGFPLYMLLGKIFCLVPIGTAVARLLLLSRLGALASLVFVYLIVSEIVKEEKGRWAGIISVLVLAFNYGFWSQAINIETFSVTNAFLFGLVYWAVKLAEKLGDKQKKLQINEKIQIWGLSLLTGVSTGLNPIVSVIALVAIYWWWKKRWLIKKQRGLFLVAIVTVILGFGVIYAYLPVRAAAKPYLNWGDPVNWERIGKHLVGAGLNIYEPETNSINGFTGQPVVWLKSLGHYLYMWWWCFTLIWLPVTIWGIWEWSKKKGNWFWPLLIIWAGNLTYVILYWGGNQESWMVSGFVVLAIALGVGVGRIWEWLETQEESFSRWAKIVLVALALVPLFFWYPLIDRSKDIFADDYAVNLYQGLPEKAVIVGGGDFFHALTAYTHEVSGNRKDISAVMGNMFYVFDWYRADLAAKTGLKVSAELEAMIKYKSAEEFTQIIDQLIADNPDRQFYVTPLLLYDTVVAGHKEGNYHTEKYKLVPNGLLLKVMPLESQEVIDEKLYDFKFKYPELMADKAPFYLERNYMNAYKLLRNDYAKAWVYLADYYLKINQEVRAEKYLQKAVDQGSTDTPEFLNRLAIFYAQMGDKEKAKKLFEKALVVAPENGDLQKNYQMFLGEGKEASGSGEIKEDQEYSGKGLTFTVPDGWKALEVDEGVMVLADDDQFTVVLKPKPGEALSLEEALKTQMGLQGELVKQGKALIAGASEALVSIYKIKGEEVMQFFIIKDKKLLEVIVGPTTDKERMSKFDTLIGGLKVKN